MACGGWAQNNYITEIKNIFNLPNLIFLDLYNNCIQVGNRTSTPPRRGKKGHA